MMSDLNSKPKNSNLAYFDITLISCFAFLFCYYCGNRGFFALDQSIVFDGAFRLISHQVPYVDFYAPNGLPVFYYQAIFFALFGVSFSSYVAAAAVLNALASLASYILVRALFPEYRLIAIGTALVTATWFYAPFGTPFPEQSALLLILIAVVVVVRGELSKCRKAFGYLLAGCLCAIAIFCKQSVSGFMLPLFPVLAVCCNSDKPSALFRNVLAWFGGLLVTLSGAVLLIWAAGGLERFLYFGIKLPWELGTRRLPLLGSLGLDGLGILILLGIWLLALLSILFRKIRVTERFNDAVTNPARIIGAVIFIYLLFVSQLMHGSLLNSGTIADVYIGILLALALVFALGLHPKKRTLISSFGAFVFFVLFAFGAFISVRRQVHESVIGAKFERQTQIQKLAGLDWGEPTLAREGNADESDVGVDVKAEDLEALVSFLMEHNQRFFIFPDFSILYGITGIPAPQPILWFHSGLTYPKHENSELDQEVKASLIKNNVKVIVLEQRSFFGTTERMREFPVLASYIASDFEVAKDIGNFRVFLHKSN